MILKDTLPLDTTTETPLYGYTIKRVGLFSGPGKVVIFGPELKRRRLRLEASEVKSWIRENYDLLATIRLTRDKRVHPRLLLVLEETVSSTWAHISWGSKDQDSGPTTVGLVQTSVEGAPQWQFMGLQDQNLSITKMVSNLTVNLPITWAD